MVCMPGDGDYTYIGFRVKDYGVLREFIRSRGMTLQGFMSLAVRHELRRIRDMEGGD